MNDQKAKHFLNFRSPASASQWHCSNRTLTRTSPAFRRMGAGSPTLLWKPAVGKSMSPHSPGFSQKRLVSNAGGRQPLWCKDGKALFYLSLDGKLISSGHTGPLDNRDGRPSRVLSAAHPKRPCSKSILRDTR